MPSVPPSHAENVESVYKLWLERACDRVRPAEMDVIVVG
jgi:hypothetical protein